MTAYLVLLIAVLSRILPHTFGTTSVGFTAVGGGLLFFGARRSGWQTVFPVLALIGTDYYLTRFVYGFAFHAQAYVVTWVWYAAVCLLGHFMLTRRVNGTDDGSTADGERTASEGKTGAPSMLRVCGAVLAASTSFFVLSNFMVWVGSTLYPHSAAGLAACYVAAIPFYANDAMSTGVTAGALFGLPVLARSIALSIRAAQGDGMPLA